jgi:hypothetical protein
MRAAEFGRTECLRLLLSSGADMTAKDSVRQKIFRLFTLGFLLFFNVCFLLTFDAFSVLMRSQLSAGMQR